MELHTESLCFSLVCAQRAVFQNMSHCQKRNMSALENHSKFEEENFPHLWRRVARLPCWFLILLRIDQVFTGQIES